MERESPSEKTCKPGVPSTMAGEREFWSLYSGRGICSGCRPPRLFWDLQAKSKYPRLQMTWNQRTQEVRAPMNFLYHPDMASFSVERDEVQKETDLFKTAWLVSR